MPRFDNLLLHSPLGIALIDYAGIYEAVNPAYCAIYGYRADELLGRSMTIVFPPEARKRMIGLHQNFLDQGGQLGGEWEVVRADGTPLHVLSDSASVPGDDGRQRRLVYVTDITAKKQAQAALAESEAQFRVLFETSPHGVIYHDAHGAITAVNPAAEEILGLSLAQLRGSNPVALGWKAIQTDGRPFPDELRPVMQALNTRQRVSNVVVGVLIADRQPIWIRVSAIPMVRDDTLIGAYAIFEDISARRQIEAALKDNEARLKAQNRSLQRYRDEREEEMQLTKKIIDRIISRQRINDPRVSSWVAPTSEFSGDIIATAYSPDQRLYVFFADATGHGLAAAISAIPLLPLFFRLAEKGRPVEIIARDLNEEVFKTVPVGHFVSAALAVFDFARSEMQLWQGGMPNVFRLDQSGRIRDSYPSQHMALGIRPWQYDMDKILEITLDTEDQVVFVSDGLIESRDQAGTEFGIARLYRVLDNRHHGEVMQNLKTALAEHVGKSSSHDDMSFLRISNRHLPSPVDKQSDISRLSAAQTL